LLDVGQALTHISNAVRKERISKFYFVLFEGWRRQMTVSLCGIFSSLLSALQTFLAVANPVLFPLSVRFLV